MNDFLIEVFAEIKNKKPDAELILVGTGPLEEKVRSKVADKGLNCARNIHDALIRNDGYLFSRSLKKMADREILQ